MKHKGIYTNGEVVKSMFDDLTLWSQWFVKYSVENHATDTIYDHRDMIPISYLLVDMDVSEDKREEQYKTMLQDLQKAFDTIDPTTNKPYPDAIKPYLRRLYTETAGTMTYDVDWNDKKEVMKFTRSLLLLQTVGTMLKKFTKEYFELFPDPQERAKIDAGVMKNLALFNRAAETIKNDYHLDFNGLNQLSLYSTAETFRTNYIEYFSNAAAQQLLDGSSELVFDPSVDPTLHDYFAGETIHEEVYDKDFDETYIYEDKDAGADIWRAFESLVENSHAEWMTVNQWHMVQSDLFLINGRSVTELFEETKAKNVDLPSDMKTPTMSKLVRDALTDGKSHVERVRFSHDENGIAKLEYIPIKLDLSKLSMKDNPITNEQRDENQKDPEVLLNLKREHLKYETKFLNTLRASKARFDSLKDTFPLFNSRRLDAYEKKLAENGSRQLTGSGSDKMLEYMMVACDNDADFSEPTSFDTINYIQDNKVDATSLLRNINFYVSNLALSEGRTADQMKDIIRSAQMAAYNYMTVHPTPDTPDDVASYNALEQMVNNPQKAFKSVMNKNLQKELGKTKSMKQCIKTLAKDGKEKVNEARLEARAAERAYKDRVDEINKSIQDVSGGLFGADDKKTGELMNRERELKDSLAMLRKAEIERLEKAYADGKLPLDYFEQRRVDIEQGKHEKTVPFGVDERPSFKQFMRDNADALDGMSSKDAKFVYNRMMEDAQREEKKFILNAMETPPKQTEPVAQETKPTEREPVSSLAEVFKEKNGKTSPEIQQAPPTATKRLE